ncbi:5-oxoprolinase subunit PxpB [Rhizobium sp. BK602]|uniref:5-oxoprolinase subunit PxpB n=1 Tax=Rhizobium sp. BK602 TaxID=2586986 RepID=UPI001617A5C5|nr:5-oxoprolinase subunit PxpB [Rhizobium sp. BK602]MBB3609962.1 KipI family sensor histidine kinase inhibitor [Rhizobium sp. BK602]
MAEMFPRIRACGDSMLSVELADHIDDAVNRRIIALFDDLSRSPVAGIEEMAPTYRSLSVIYDPAIIRGGALADVLQKRLRALSAIDTSSCRYSVPVVYGGAVGIDLDELARMKDMTTTELVNLHASAEYRVHMIGFAPGFAYLGGLPDALHTPRLATPRQRIEASAIGIGGKQASINSVPGPSGWRFIGRTPVRLFDPHRTPPFLLKAGDRIRFHPIGEAEAARLDAMVAAGQTVLQPEVA